MTGRISFSLCLLLIAFVASAQNSIKGRVVNAATGEALAGASVFINGTSIGTAADRAGQFELTNVPRGRYELIISLIGYETNVFNFTSDQLPLNLKVEMTLKVKELENVVVEPSVEEGWDKWGRIFTQSFIGKTPNAEKCTIKNTKAIRFRYFKRSNRVIAYCDEPIIIENRALGYNLRYQLEAFEINYKSAVTSYSGYPFFEKIERGRKGLQQRWKEAREKAFYGSMMHFMRCLYADSLLQSGYEVRRMQRVTNEEKERVKKVYQGAMTIRDSAGVRIVNNNLPNDSLVYYRQVMRQKDYTEVYDTSLLSLDSLLIKKEGDYKILYFPNYLYITYKNELEDKAYIADQGENRNPMPQRSLIWLVSGSPIVIEANGNYYPPEELFSSAYWGWHQKNAELLPSDYRPGD